MSDDTPHVLFVDDERMLHNVVERLLGRHHIRVTACSGGSEALDLLRREPVDLVLSDFQMPEMDGLELLAQVREQHPSLPVIIITGYANVQHAVRSMRSGAVDYLPKPFATEVLVERVRAHLARAAEAPAPTPEKAAASGGSSKKASGASASAPTFIGEDPKLRELKAFLPRLAASGAPVFVHGESGVGKEVVARLVHAESDRASGPFVALNCANLPSELVESHLFGHKKGAFTGAISERKGLFETASGGTLFLDEVGEMSLVMQVKLLRALQEQRVRPVGATREVEVDVRILAATNRDLASMVEEGTFRQDLYYRLATLVIRLPPLRQRAADIPLLVRHILRDACARLGAEPPIVTGGAVEALMGYTWPGNIRQLENVIRAALALRDGDITADVVRPLIQAQGPAPRPIATAPAPATMGSTVQVGRPPKCGPEEVRAALEGAGYNRSQAAEELGVSLRTLQRYIKKYRLG